MAHFIQICYLAHCSNKNILMHTHNRQGFFYRLNLNLVYIRKLVQRRSQLGLWYQLGKYSRLYNIGVHDKILANQGGRGTFNSTHFISSTNRKVWWFYVEVHRMENLLGLGAKSVCGFFPRKSKMTSKMVVKTPIF